MLRSHSFHVCNVCSFAGEAGFAVGVWDGVVAFGDLGLQDGGVGEAFVFSFGGFEESLAICLLFGTSGCDEAVFLLLPDAEL